MINDPFHVEETLARRRDRWRRMIVGAICALAVAAVLLAGYTYIRKYHAQQILANNPPAPVSDSAPKGPPLAHVVIDEPTIAKGTTIIGGVVKNISQQELESLSVVIELRRRKDGGLEESVLPVTPARLQPNEEGSYSLKVSAQDFASLRLVGLTVEPNASSIAYSSSQGKKRPAERLEPIVVKPPGKPGEFLNSPDNPGRLP